MKNSGLMYALTAYTMWGLVPLYWKQLSAVDNLQIVLHRMLWSFVFVIGLIFILRQGRELYSLLRQKQIVIRSAFGSVLVSVNWAIYIWAVNSGHIVEASMGYFINPLFNVLLGIVFFRERLNRAQWLAIAIAASGVAYLIIAHGTVPYIALTLAITFTSYGAFKKTVHIPAVQGMAIETGILFIPTLIFLLVWEYNGSGVFGDQWSTDGLLIVGGLVTLVPLIFFSAAAKKVSMTVLGMSQYIGPTLQLLIGVLVYKETFGSTQFISFGLIWLALVIYSVDQLIGRKNN